MWLRSQHLTSGNKNFWVRLITCFHDSWIYEFTNFFHEIFFVLFFYNIEVFYWDKNQSMKFSQKNIDNWRFWKTQFFWVGHFDIFLLKKNCFISMKISQRFLDIKTGSKLWWLSWFPAKKSLPPNISATSIPCEPWNKLYLLKYGSEEKGSWFCKCSIILGFLFV